MSEERKRSMDPEDREVIFPEAHSTIEAVFSYLDEDTKRSTQSYGHALGMLAQVAYANSEHDFDYQKNKLKLYAEELIGRFGNKIIEFMRPELREALGLEDASIE